MTTVLHADSADVADALERLGLTEQPLLAAVTQGYLARIDCTANHPPLFPSFVAWGETVRSLREQLSTAGWTRSDERNYSRTINPDGNIAIAVATGDAATGHPASSPSTKSAKGPSTIEAVEINRAQLSLPGLGDRDARDEVDGPPITTWLLLVCYDQEEVRAELSLPSAIGDDGRVSVWQERIMLRALPLDSGPIAVAPPTLPDIDVVVRRKA